MSDQAPSESALDRFEIIHGIGDDDPTEFARDVRHGLSACPKTLPCQYFYDEAGSRFFENICELPEYYLTRAEDDILATHADTIMAGWSDPPLLIELGSGGSSKTRRLISSGLRFYGRLHYQPIEISSSLLTASSLALVNDYDQLRVTAYACNYLQALQMIVASERSKLFAFLGSSLGNYDDTSAVRLLHLIASRMTTKDRLLLGVDVDKDPTALVAAYNDAQGTTAEFNRNILARMNRELDAEFDLNAFDHEATYQPYPPRIEMHLVSKSDHDVIIPTISSTVHFGARETIHTESSHKYTPSRLAGLAKKSGFEAVAAWTDRDSRFVLQLWRRSGVAARPSL